MKYKASLLPLVLLQIFQDISALSDRDGKNYDELKHHKTDVNVPKVRDIKNPEPLNKEDIKYRYKRDLLHKYTTNYIPISEHGYHKISKWKNKLKNSYESYVDHDLHFEIDIGRSKPPSNLIIEQSSRNLGYTSTYLRGLHDNKKKYWHLPSQLPQSSQKIYKPSSFNNFLKKQYPFSITATNQRTTNNTSAYQIPADAIGSQSNNTSNINVNESSQDVYNGTSRYENHFESTQYANLTLNEQKVSLVEPGTPSPHLLTDYPQIHPEEYQKYISELYDENYDYANISDPHNHSSANVSIITNELNQDSNDDHDDGSNEYTTGLGAALPYKSKKKYQNSGLSNNQYSRPNYQFPLTTNNQNRQPNFNQYKQPINRQYKVPVINQLKGPVNNQFKPLAKNDYKLAVTNQYRPAVKKQYYPALTNQVHTNQFNQLYNNQYKFPHNQYKPPSNNQLQPGVINQNKLSFNNQFAPPINYQNLINNNLYNPVINKQQPKKLMPYNDLSQIKMIYKNDPPDPKVSPNIYTDEDDCEYQTSWTMNCYNCICNGSTASCIRNNRCRRPPENEPKLCKPYTSFTLDGTDCHRCKCNADGLPVCTFDYYACARRTGETFYRGDINGASRRKSLDKSLRVQRPWMMRSLTTARNSCPVFAMDLNVWKCKPQSQWNGRCFSCVCSNDGQPICKKTRGCVPPPSGMPPKCKPGSKLTMQGCADCWCDDDGFPAGDVPPPKSNALLATATLSSKKPRAHTSIFDDSVEQSDPPEEIAEASNSLEVLTDNLFTDSLEVAR